MNIVEFEEAFERLSVRARNALLKLRITNPEELSSVSWIDLMGLPGCGHVTSYEIFRWCERNGLEGPRGGFRSARQIVKRPSPGEPSRMARIEAKLDRILAWIETQETPCP